MYLALTVALAFGNPCTVTDGDTIRCGEERIRLTGIDAPELRGHCARGRRCARSNAKASAANLRALLRAGPLTIRRLGRDHYGRTLAVVSVGGRNLACAQLASRAAIYKPRWDTGRHVAHACPGLAKTF